MSKIKVRVQRTDHIYIHNNLANAGHYFQQLIGRRIANNDREGIGIEMMAALTMMAFAIEAQVNFLAAKLNPAEWDDRDPVKDKLKKVAKHIGLTVDFGKRPYQTITVLKDFRDTLAHGKPVTIVGEPKEIITTHEELEKLPFPEPEWSKYQTQAYVDQASNDTLAIWKELLEAAKLHVIGEIPSTHGFHSIQFLEHVD